ncbi:MAG: matrixin family metalloprotease [Planctomycetes bacterium]|nr:matrixin family metalloprotease [Planctomycetota bacterium]
MQRSAVRAAAVALSVLLAGSEVPAYLVRRTPTGTEITWNTAASAPNVVGGEITFYVDTASAEDVTGEQFRTAVMAAIQSWEDVDGSALSFREDAARPATVKSASDKVNRMGFTPGVIPPFAFASAFAATSNNRIVDVDVVFNPDMTWSVQSPGVDAKADVQGVAAHEWGHGLGLDHVPLGRSTMFYAASYGSISLRSLEADDAASVVHAYPDGTEGTLYATISGDADIAGTADDRGVQVTAVDFVTGLPVVSAVSLSDGSFTLEGVPPGVYRLLASPLGTEKRDGGVYSDFWDGAATSFLPAVRGQDGAADGSTGVIVAEAGDAISGVTFALSGTDASGEPNNGFAEAKALDLGDSVGGRIASSSDRDWFSFAGTAGQKVSVHLHAQQIGSDLDPRIYLRNAARIEIAISQDISQGYTTPEGADLDCRILDFELPSTGTFYVEVEAESSPDSSRPEDFFYVLTLLPGGGAPSPLTSVLAASPAVIPADGTSTATVTFEPRSLTGGLSGPGLDVDLELAADGNPDGSLGSVVDEGDGTYTAVLTAPSSGGSDLLRARVDGAEIASTTVSYRGEASFAASDFTVSPRRVRPGAAGTAAAVLVPRDAAGIPFGAGATVTLTLAGDPSTGIGGTTDLGNGSYRATLSPGPDRETVSVGALVEGESLDGTIPFGVGFPAEEVVDEVLDALDGLLEGGALPAKSVSKVQKARDLLAAAGGTGATLVKGVQKAVKQLEAAAKKGAAAGDLAAELAEACREEAELSIGESGPAADEAAEQKALAKAGALFDGGEALLDALKYSKSCSKYGAALKQTAKILP